MRAKFDVLHVVMPGAPIDGRLAHLLCSNITTGFQFKIAYITYKTIHTTQPAYLNSVLEHYTPAHTLRSSDTNLFSVP